MEKFHKYCLSVLLVIICSNIPAQSTTCPTENNDYAQLCDVYKTILGIHCGEIGKEQYGPEKTNGFITIHQREKASESFNRIFSIIRYKAGFQTDYPENILSENEQHDHILRNFENHSKHFGFAGIIYFKTKVSKIRNKDYLEDLS